MVNSSLQDRPLIAAGTRCVPSRKGMRQPLKSAILPVMRFVSSLFMLSFLAMTGCGSMLSGPSPDMAPLPPPGAGPGHGSHAHGSARHRQGSGVSYADDAPVMPMPPGAESPAAPSHDTSSGPSSGGMSFGGQGGSVDIAPHPATPDTEVSYGQNNTPN
ncbi:hypothetical protein NKW55_02790 [Gluconobacter kondonii]|uniref:hypothetical protein n=1 Tax=Gluconobacter kondonii TaxID=941463 RepID=UPI00209F68E1|nr:hypothetical protein [Gluconobacter kondonii]MCP1235535.1 hypothetical protein [Gluconobacter kondonii]